ncbi:MAG: hypothetical protein DMF61_23360 [Blastocatellia bacterium AA13]|nr:MAG: hypothetical protein DMF61_23360 [Blastocatellia bacterium AA13]
MSFCPHPSNGAIGYLFGNAHPPPLFMILAASSTIKQEADALPPILRKIQSLPIPQQKTLLKIVHRHIHQSW